VAKANLYFEGKVISHTIFTAEGKKITLGVILPGTYHFGTGVGERMDITDGECNVVLDGVVTSTNYSSGQSFEVPGNSGFSITVTNSPCQYVCNYLD